MKSLFIVLLIGLSACSFADEAEVCTDPTTGEVVECPEAAE